MDNRAFIRMRATRNLRIFILYIAFVIIAEVVTSFYDPSYGLLLHSIMLVSLLALSALKHEEGFASRLFLSLSLAPLIRILSLSLPLIYFPRRTWYLVVSIPVFAAALTLMRVEGMGLGDVGITLEKPFTQIGVALMSVPFGIVEYFILRPDPLAAGLSLVEFAILSAALVFSTGSSRSLFFGGYFKQAR